jgi:hypothetical protein
MSRSDSNVSTRNTSMCALTVWGIFRGCCGFGPLDGGSMGDEEAAKLIVIGMRLPDMPTPQRFRRKVTRWGLLCDLVQKTVKSIKSSDSASVTKSFHVTTGRSEGIDEDMIDEEFPCDVLNFFNAS